MKPRGIDINLSPSRDLEHGCFTGLISDDERGVLGAVLGNDRSLGSQIIVNECSETCNHTYGREHPKSFIQRAIPLGN